MTRFRRALVVTLAAILVLAPATAAQAEGSVPAEVAAYVADGSLREQLNDVYGLNAAGDGIDFDDSTTMGTIERVHVWTAAFRAGEETDHRLELVNEWTVPVSIAEESVGLAIVWINPATVRAELASFEANPDLAAALSAVPDGESLVHDAPSAAWLALADDGTLTALVPGRTGLSTPVPVDSIALLPTEDPAPPQGDPGTGMALATGVLLVLFAVIVVALVVPVVRGRAASVEEPPGDASDAPETPEPVEEPTDSEKSDALAPRSKKKRTLKVDPEPTAD